MLCASRLSMALKTSRMTRTFSSAFITSSLPCSFGTAKRTQSHLSNPYCRIGHAVERRDQHSIQTPFAFDFSVRWAVLASSNSVVNPHSCRTYHVGSERSRPRLLEGAAGRFDAIGSEAPRWHLHSLGRSHRLPSLPRPGSDSQFRLLRLTFRPVFLAAPAYICSNLFCRFSMS